MANQKATIGNDYLERLARRCFGNADIAKSELVLACPGTNQCKTKKEFVALLVPFLADQPELQQKLADLADYTPSKWLLTQEIPAIQERRKIFKEAEVAFNPAFDPEGDGEGDDPYAWARGKAPLRGICFSGGGIRSATFNLGVLQGLAKLGKLTTIDYLSSVSGGGYIHEWFAAWVRREEERSKAKSAGGYASGDGFKEVVKQLEPLPSTKDYPAHPEPIRWLRRYSNYLTPQKGLFTADTWVAVAIWLRNTFLNQLVLVSGLVLVLLVPNRVGEPITMKGSGAWAAPSLVVVVGLFLFATAMLAMGLRREYSRTRKLDDDERALREKLQAEAAAARIADATAQVQAAPPAAKAQAESAKAEEAKVSEKPDEEERSLWGEGKILTFVIVPLLLASALHLGWLLALPKSLHSGRFVPELEAVFLLLWLLICAIGFAGSASRAYKILHETLDAPDGEDPRSRIWRQLKNAVNGVAGLVILNAGISAFFGTLFFWAVCWVLDLHPPVALAKVLSLSATDEWRYKATVGPPLLLSVPFFTVVIGAGLVGREFADWLREWLARVRAWALLVGFGWTALFGIALLGPLLFHLHKLIRWPAAAAWAATTAGSVLAGKSNKTSGGVGAEASRSKALDLLAKVGPYVFAVGLLLLIATGMELACAHIPSNYVWWWRSMLSVVPPLAVFLLFGWRVDVNEFSLNPFYRNRLTRCYLGASNRQRSANPLTGFDDRDTRGMQISRLTAIRKLNATEPEDDVQYTGPFPIICAALNLSFGEDLAWQERKAASFAFTPLHSGYHVGWTAGKSGTRLSYNGYVPTAEYAFPDGGINIATAVAISGAAASPNWGYHTNPATAFLMTMFNVRLGWWLPNPRRSDMGGRTCDAKCKKQEWSSPRFAPTELIKELLGMADDSAKYVYLSDGGHFENMGLYELVRRRCYRIVICDAEQDENYFFEGIANAIRKCRVDFGVEITLDLNDLRPFRKTGDCKAHFASGTIRYPETPPDAKGKSDNEGKILYIKSSLTGKHSFNDPKGGAVPVPCEPVDIVNFKFSDKDFPHDSTANQWFTESQFESYRRLGYHVVDEIEEYGEWNNVLS